MTNAKTELVLDGLLEVKERCLPHRSHSLDWSRATSGRPDFGGVYVFWWRGGPRRFYRMLEQRALHYAGPKGEHLTLKVRPARLLVADNGELPLYVGKNAAGIASRVGKHLKLKTRRTVQSDAVNQPSHRMTTSCQVRDRLDRLFPSIADTRELVLDNVMLSYVRADRGPESFAERFFIEHAAIAAFRPIFNIDSER